MTRPVSSRRALVAALSLILLTNGVVLAGVAWNRAGEPESLLQLGERELYAPYRGYSAYENSGVALGLAWQVLATEPEPARYGVYGAYGNRDAGWLTAPRLRELGFAVPEPGTARQFEHFRAHARSRDVLLVLELDGAAYRESLARDRLALETARKRHEALPGDETLARQLKDAQDGLRDAETKRSRLFAVDAGLDAGALRAKYPDRSRYAIVRGRVAPMVTGTPEKPQLNGYIEELAVGTIHLPAATLALKPGDDVTRYVVDVAWGRRFEPWVVGGKTLPPAAVPAQTRE